MDVAIPQPVVWSQPIEDASAWRAANFARDFSWIVTWSDADLTELEAALRHACRLGMTAETVTRDGFPLPTPARRARLPCRNSTRPCHQWQGGRGPAGRGVFQ